MKNFLIITLFLLILVLIYFISIDKKSIISYFQVKKVLVEKINELKSLKDQSELLKSKINKLKDDSLDLDYLDEVAREKHNLSNSDEVIIFNKQK
tara:strand:- start:629 stop:913 length:285 start_codon:yes stop_codon:yes gene_type:complete